MTHLEAKTDRPALDLDEVVKEVDAAVAELDGVVKKAEDAAKRLRAAEDGLLGVLAAPTEVVADDDQAAAPTSPG